MSVSEPDVELEADGLAVRYGAVTALRDTSLRVRGGDLVAVTGPSGAGKTSLLSALGGARRPDAGTVRLDGAAVRSRDDAVARGVVLVPQGNALVRILTALENVAVPLLLVDSHRTDRAEAARRAQEALSVVGLADAGGRLVEELSGGQQQRVAVARGLASRGRVLLADEPTSELDAANRVGVMALLRAEAQRGAAVVVATHDPEAAALCDAELRLDEGTPSWRR